MSISKIVLYFCCILVLVLPYLAYAMDESISCYLAALLLLLAAIWGIVKIRRSAQKKVHLSRPLGMETSLRPQSQQLANDIMSTYIGSIYDKARFMSDFDMEKELETIFSHAVYTLEQHDLILEDNTLEQLRLTLLKTAQRGLKDRKTA
ncbi:hypothetical protein [Halodesulfovibrio marinisediminis]|nr:hypothetical protein [Halodesulfovibrio marinisediminis]